MSSFKRKIASKTPALSQGTRLSPSSSSTTIISTGIPSLDDILGGGLPLSCSFTILAPDNHSAYGELVQKYFIAQGLACSQRVCVIDDNAEVLLKECMWMPDNPASVSASASGAGTPVEDEETDKAADGKDNIKIAWRYEQMKTFQTTITSDSSPSEDFCSPLDLTCRIPSPILDNAKTYNHLSIREVSVDDGVEKSTSRVIQYIQEVLQRTEDASSSRLLRICIPSLGSPSYGDLEPQDILFFLYRLRVLLRQHPTACASLCLVPQLCTDEWGGTGWVQKLGWLTDALVSMVAFPANPSLTSLFPTHHGFLHIHTLPSPHTLLPASDKLSVLRGLSSSNAATGAGGSGENNLAFRCTRRRLVVETMHLDLEGGVSERRTAPPGEAVDLEGPVVHASLETFTSNPHAFATISVELEGAREGERVGAAGRSEKQATTTVKPPAFAKVKKPKKKVAFHSEKPDLYDF